jgi:hypothetical protein
MALKDLDDVADALELTLEEGTKDHFETQRQLEQSGPLFN